MPGEAAPPVVLIAGLGNVLMRDDGVGVHAARVLMADRHPPGIEVVEIGTAVLHAVDLLERAAAIVALDAVDAGQPPGTVLQMHPGGAHAGAVPPSLHDLSLLNALRMLGRREPPPVVVVGVQPAVIEPGLELSAPVQAAVPRLVARAREAAAALSEGARLAGMVHR